MKISPKYSLLALLLVAGVGYVALGKTDVSERPQPLPPVVVQAWRNAGAVPGWMTATTSRESSSFSPAAEGQKEDLPAFRFPVWNAGVVPVLPQPPRAFGLDISEPLAAPDEPVPSPKRVTDAAIRDLAGLKNLQMLDLGDTWVTDAGLSGLASFKNLQSLRLDGTKVTDGGVKKLQQELPKCRIVR